MANNKTLKGQIKRIYEVQTPTTTISKQRICVEDSMRKNYFLTFFNNSHLLKGFAVNDIVIIDCAVKQVVKDKQIYENFYANSIMHSSSPVPKYYTDEFVKNQSVLWMNKQWKEAIESKSGIEYSLFKEGKVDVEGRDIL